MCAREKVFARNDALGIARKIIICYNYYICVIRSDRKFEAQSMKTSKNRFQNRHPLPILSRATRDRAGVYATGVRR